MKRQDLYKPCAVCGQPFKCIAATMARRKYCSYRCRNIAQFGPETQTINWHCAYCGTGAHLTPFWVHRKKYCSLECRNKHYSVIRRGEAGTNWKGGVALIARSLRTSRTMKNWIAQVMAASEGKCHECGGEACHAHHVKGVAELLAEMFDPANGVALCGECHAAQPDHNANFVRPPRQAATG